MQHATEHKAWLKQNGGNNSKPATNTNSSLEHEQASFLGFEHGKAHGKFAFLTPGFARARLATKLKQQPSGSELDALAGSAKLALVSNFGCSPGTYLLDNANLLRSNLGALLFSAQVALLAKLGS